MKTLITIACASLLFGCSATANDPGSPDQDDVGKLSLSWTFDQQNDSEICQTSALATISIDVTTVDGQPAASLTKDCKAMTALTVLPPGHYMATARCMDANGLPRSLPIQTTEFAIDGTDRVNKAVDFPSSAVYPKDG